jgi:branched-chain amino acid aminotransferase
MAGTADFVWMDGQFLPWAEAKLHIATEAVIRAASVFEGMRGYGNAEQGELYIFRNAEHLARLRDSARVMHMQVEYSDAELTQVFRELLRRNNFRDHVHFRPTVYFDVGESNAYKPEEIRTGMFVFALNRPTGKAQLEGVRSGTSSWRRNTDLASPSRVKAAGNYHNSRLAHVEARLNGFTSPLMLNDRGKVAEGPGACFMMVRRGKLITPPITADILESITRDTLIQLAQAELGLEVVEREIDRSEVYIADEAFFCGSGAEVTPVIALDHYKVGTGAPGELTKRIQRLYFDVAEGRVEKYRHWLTPVWKSNE